MDHFFLCWALTANAIADHIALCLVCIWRKTPPEKYHLRNVTININSCSYRIKYEVDKIFTCLFLNYFGYSVTARSQNIQFSLKARYLCTQISVIELSWTGLVKTWYYSFQMGKEIEMIPGGSLKALPTWEFFTVKEFWFKKDKE